jgi:NAD(P)-dependent dehydrogenase (short-subunit alcohol dehydrogenase family)
MAERKSGVIICICGLGGEKLEFGYIAGAAGNASLMAFARAMGGRSPDYGVRVLAVNPGPVMTDRIEFLGRTRAKRELGDENRYMEGFKHMPYGRPATVEEVAPMVVFLASPLSNYISGTVVTIDAGIANRSANA